MGSEIDAGEGRRITRRMDIVRWPALCGLLASLLTAGCADSGAASDNDKRGGFYGGMSGGGTWP